MTRLMVFVGTSAILGIVSGAIGAACLNAAGLILTSRGFERAYFWEPGESPILAAAGFLLLLVWFISLLPALRLVLAKPRRSRPVLWATGALILLSLSLVASIFWILLVISPATYGLLLSTG